ncbi:MAG: triose-phosphate isomerase, partial [Candidatus Pacebacteria bacterium]|nr:triose-phosphate isomerase [Candidatus Paceibacterota bacterium]
MKYVFANWKCNPGGTAEAKKLLAGYAKLFKKSKKATAGVFPPACYLQLAKEMLKGKAALGGQNCHWEAGAYTGEMSPAQLKSLGCGYALVGHSERRHKFGESNESINKKMKAVMAAGMVPVLCVGETREERIAGKITEIVEAQVKEGMADIDINTTKVIIAYEPVWAIGTGQACSSLEADVVRQFVRNITSEK